MKKKNLLIFLMVLVMGLMMTACGGGDTADEDTGSSGGSAADYSFDLTDFSFSDDFTTLTFDMVLDNQTGDSVVPSDVVKVRAIQDDTELTIPAEDLDGPALGGTATKYEITVTLNSDTMVTVEVLSREDGTVIVSKEVPVESD